MRLRADQRLDLAQLDAKTAQFYLAVESAEDTDVAVFVKFRVVTRAVHTLTSVFHKRLGCFFGQIAVTLGNALAADVQLTDDAVGRKISVSVHDVFPIIEKRFADSHIRGVGQIGGIAGNRDLGGAVGVDDRDITGALPDRVAQRQGITLAARHHQLAAGKRGAKRLILHILLQARRRSVHAVNAVSFHQLRQRARIVHLILAGKHQCLAVTQRRRMLLEGHVKGNRRHRQIGVDMVFQIMDMRVCRVRRQITTDSPVTEHDALGLACGTRGVDHIRQRVAVHVDLGIIRLCSVKQLFHIDRLIRGIITQLIRGSDNKRCAAVFENIPDPVGGILRIARNERRSRLVHTEQAAEKDALAR